MSLRHSSSYHSTL